MDRPCPPAQRTDLKHAQRDNSHGLVLKTFQSGFYRDLLPCFNTADIESKLMVFQQLLTFISLKLDIQVGQGQM